MASCSRCGRPVAVARPSCLYCGAPLGGAAIEAAEAARKRPAPESEPEAAPGLERALLVGRLENADPEQLAAVLGCSRLEAEQARRRGGPELLHLRPVEEAAAECERLRACGASVRALSEHEVRRGARPWVAAGGRQRGDGGLELRSAGDERVLAPGSLLLVVQGRIQREYQPRVARRPRTATLEQGYRIHLHAREGECPVELDPGGFEFDGESEPGSSLLRLRSWLEQLGAVVPVDDRFRFMPPALGPEEPTQGGALAASAGLRRRGGDDENVILDNLRQFRFYSAWRGAWERAEAG